MQSLETVTAAEWDQNNKNPNQKIISLSAFILPVSPTPLPFSCLAEAINLGHQREAGAAAYYLEKSLPEGSRKFTSRVPKKEKSQRYHWIRLRLEGVQAPRTADIPVHNQKFLSIMWEKEPRIVSPDALVEEQAATASP